MRSVRTPVVSRRSVREALRDDDGLQFGKVLLDAVQFIDHLGQLHRCEVYGDSADPVDASQKSRAGQPVVELHDLLFHPAAMGMGQGIGRIVADRADVAEMVVESLQFQKEGPQIAGTAGHFEVQERFHRLAVGEAMADRRIAGHAFGQWHRCDQFLLLEQFFHSTVFPEMAHFELHDRLTGHGKSEMPGLDDAGMDRADRHFKDPFAFNVAEVVFALLPTQDAVPGKSFFNGWVPFGQCSCRTRRRRSGWPCGINPNMSRISRSYHFAAWMCGVMEGNSRSSLRELNG